MNTIIIDKIVDLLWLCGSFKKLLLVAFEEFLISVTLLLLPKLQENCLLPLHLVYPSILIINFDYPNTWAISCDQRGPDNQGSTVYVSLTFEFIKTQLIMYYIHYAIFCIFRHRWLHSMTDRPPTVEPPTPRKFLTEHTENFSATEKEYVPYSTVKPKIQSWQPK